VLFGDPGVGKTTLMQDIAGRIGNERECGAVTCGAIYFSRSENFKTETEIQAVLMELLRSLVERSEAYPDSMKNLYRIYSKSIPSSEEIMQVLAEILTKAERSCIIVDAIDECHHEKTLNPVLQNLRRLQEWTKVGIVLTDRPGRSHSRERYFQPSDDCREIRMETNSGDMEAYIRSFVSRYGSAAHNDETLLKRTLEVICEASAKT
jgi:nucleoside-triphosphatase THEP1